MTQLNLSTESAKRAYNWFHHAYPDYKNNPNCTIEDITLRNELESWLIAKGE